MDYCGPRGIPHSTFLGWSDLDRDKALEWFARDQSRCQGCGTPPVDWDEARGGDREAYHPTVTECQGCAIRATVEGDEKAGVRKTLVPNPFLTMWGGPFLSSAVIPRG